MTLRWSVVAVALVLFAAPLAPASSQQNPSPGLKDPACTQAAKAEVATPPQPEKADGTAPGNAGSTGWSGGLGGSNIGTSQNGPTQGSKTYQPAVARGLDPIAGPAKPAVGRC